MNGSRKLPKPSNRAMCRCCLLTEVLSAPGENRCFSAPALLSAQLRGMHCINLVQRWPRQGESAGSLPQPWTGSSRWALLYINPQAKNRQCICKAGTAPAQSSKCFSSQNPRSLLANLKWVTVRLFCEVPCLCHALRNGSMAVHYLPVNVTLQIKICAHPFQQPLTDTAGRSEECRFFWGTNSCPRVCFGAQMPILKRVCVCVLAHTWNQKELGLRHPGSELPKNPI